MEWNQSGTISSVKALTFCNICSSCL